MSQTTQYPMNFYSRAVTNASGTAPSWLYFLMHADRASVSSGTQFVDQSSFDVSLYTRGTGVTQVTGGVFGNSWIQFSGGSTTAANARIGWTHPGILATTATDTKPAFQMESFLYFTSLNSAAMMWFEISNDGHTDYGQHYFYQTTAGQWRVAITWVRSGIGNFVAREWILSTMVTGSLMHFAVVRVNTEGAGSHRMTVFQNGSQLSLVSGGSPTSGSGDWTDVTFANPQGNRLIFGGSFVSVAGTNPYSSITGYMDETRFLYDSVDGLAFDTLASVYYFNVPTAPYAPLDGTYNINFKTMSLTSATLSPTTDGGLSLGASGSTWLDLWSSGTAYLNRVGQNFTMVGTTRINFGTASVYMFGSSSGYLTLVAGTQIDLQANVGMSAVNFIFDTVTGVKFGTTTNVKMGFYGATPIVRPASTVDLKDSLVNLGLITDGGATPLNLDGGALTASSGSFSGQVSIGGGFYATGYHYHVAVVGSNTTTYTLTTASNDFLICATGVDTSVILPAAGLTGKVYWIKNVSSVGTVTVSIGTVASTGIDTVSTYTIAPSSAAMFVDGRIVYTGSGPLTGFTSRQLITVSTDTAVAVGSQTSFPLLVRLTTANFTFAHAKSDGSDIIFGNTAGDVNFSHQKLFYGFTLDTTTNAVAGSTITADVVGGNWATLTSVTDGNDATFANSQASVGTHWIRFQLGAAVKVTYVKIKPYLNANGATLKDFTVDGSNDTTGAWTTIYTGQHASNSQYEAYYFTNNTAYSFYRINMTNSWQTPGLVGIYEVQMYSNATTQMGLFMVNVPSVTAGTTFYMYFGNATATDLSTSAAWNTSYQAVWTMHSVASGSTAQVTDYTSYGRHATAAGASIPRPVLTWNSLWGFVLSFQGSHFLSVSDDSVWDDGMVNWTWTMWVLETATSGNKAYVGRGNDGASYLYWGKDNGAALRWRDFNGGPDINTLSPSIVTNSVTMLTMKRSSNQFELYSNATSIGTASNSAALISRTTPLTIGANSSINYFVNGIMWNLHISTVARGTDYIKTKYYSDSDQLVTLAAEGTFTAGGGTVPTYHWTTFKH